MPPLPVVSGARAVKAFVLLGWRIDRRESSHVTLVKDGLPVALSIPQHRELGRGLLRGLIRTAGITVEDFVHASHNC